MIATIAILNRLRFSSGRRTTVVTPRTCLDCGTNTPSSGLVAWPRSLRPAYSTPTFSPYPCGRIQRRPVDRLFSLLNADVPVRALVDRSRLFNLANQLNLSTSTPTPKPHSSLPCVARSFFNDRLGYGLVQLGDRDAYSRNVRSLLSDRRRLFNLANGTLPTTTYGRFSAIFAARRTFLFVSVSFNSANGTFTISTYGRSSAIVSTQQTFNSAADLSRLFALRTLQR